MPYVCVVCHTPCKRCRFSLQRVSLTTCSCCSASAQVTPTSWQQTQYPYSSARCTTLSQPTSRRLWFARQPRNSQLPTACTVPISRLLGVQPRRSDVQIASRFLPAMVCASHESHESHKSTPPPTHPKVTASVHKVCEPNTEHHPLHHRTAPQRNAAQRSTAPQRHTESRERLPQSANYIIQP